jgi:hypothetical protein
MLLERLNPSLGGKVNHPAFASADLFLSSAVAPESCYAEMIWAAEILPQ